MHVCVIMVQGRFRVNSMASGIEIGHPSTKADILRLGHKISMQMVTHKKLLVIQYGGDYKDAYYNIAEGNSEYYANQRYSVNAVSHLKDRFDEVATLCCQSSGSYSEILEPGLRAIGIGAALEDYESAIKKTIIAIRQYEPSFVILRTPAIDVMRWLRKRKIPSALILADSFNGRSLSDRLRYFRLARECNHHNVRWIGNHGVGSCLSLRNIGIRADKIVPWDWPVSINPSAREPKILDEKNAHRLIYVGAISIDKGVTDCIEAVNYLRRAGVSVALDIYGKGQLQECRSLVEKLGLLEYVNFCGLVPNSEIIPRMAAADVVLIPSRSSYPEGFPKTINEGLCSRTPLVVSNHPIFARLLKNGENAMVFKSASGEDLALKIRELLVDPSLYHALSNNAFATWQRLQIAVKWGDLFKNIAINNPEGDAWLHANRLDSGIYDLSV